ncbi:RHS repeat-associated core domain-containing protein [Planctomycetota bacterium]
MTTVWAQFTVDLDPATVIADNVQLIGAGPDDEFDTGDDLPIVADSVNYDVQAKQINFEYEAGLTEGIYRLHIDDAIHGTLGLALDGEGDYVASPMSSLPSGNGIAGGDFVASFVIDTTAPSNPIELRSTSHFIDEPAADDVVSVRWTAAQDALSGIGGYRVGWDVNPETDASELVIEIPATQFVRSPQLGDGDGYWFHIAAFDSAGNLSEAAHLGPLVIETGGPAVSSVTPADGLVDPTPPSTIQIAFEDRDLDASTMNVATFVVQASGGDRTFEDGNEVMIPELDGLINYDPDTRTATFEPASPLPTDTYQVTLSDSVADLSGRPLNGDADAFEGGDFISFFSVGEPQHVSGTIGEDTTWTGLIVIDGSVVIPEGRTLTIDPGAIVKFKDGKLLNVRGTLHAVSTLAQPIVFTSWKDDSVGGDTNEDADASVPDAGDWNGIRFRSATASGLLQNTRVMYGYRAVAGETAGTEIQLSNTILQENQYGIYVYTPLVEVEAENCLIADNAFAGVFVRADSRAVLLNCTIVGNGYGGSGPDAAGIHVGGPSLTVENSIVAFNANGLHHTGDIPLLTVRNSDFFNPHGQEVLWDDDPGEPKLNENGNRHADPLFVDRTLGDYTLAPGSPAVDAGRGIDAPKFDLAGRPRYDDPGIANVGSGSPSYVDMGAFERQNPTQPGDLAVVNVARPEPADVSPGETVTVEWTVENVGERLLDGPWYDAVYLSADAFLSVRTDRLLYHGPHSDSLSVGAAYTQSWTGELPDDVAGPYYVLVQTNAGGEAAVSEASLEDNVRAAGEVLAVAVPPLAGTQVGHLDEGEWAFYRYDAESGESLQVAVDSSAAVGSVHLYVRRGTSPTVSSYSAAATVPRQADQQLQLLAPVEGTYYVGVYAQSLPPSGTDFTLTSETRGLTVDRVTPSQVGNAGRVTIRIEGDAFETDAEVQLVGPGGMIIESEELYWDPATLFATFDLGEARAPAEDYDVRVTNPGFSSTTAFDALTVESGGAPELEARLIVPSLARPGRQTPVQIEYQNIGNVDMPSPLLTVVSLGELSWIRPDPQVPYIGLMVLPPDRWPDFGRVRPLQPIQPKVVGTVSVLGLSPDGPATTLRPGQTYTLTVDAITPFQTGNVPFELFVLGGPDGEGIHEDIDWDQLEEDIRPPDVPADAWDPLFARLQAQTGDTWGDYVAVLRDNADHLAEVHQRVYDAGELFSFEFVQAAGMGTPSYLKMEQDAYCPAPGLPLTLDRYFLPSPSYRARLGALGRGWTHSYEITLQERSDGTVVVNGASGLSRFFEPDGDGGYVPSPGDYGTLAAQTDASFLLMETSGLETRFGSDGCFTYIREPNGNQITAIYGPHGRLVEVRHLSGDCFTFEYYPNGRLRSVTDHADRTTTYGYDGTGEHLISVTGPDDQVTSYTYTTGEGALRDHHIESITYPGGPVAWFSYDGLGRLEEQYVTGVGQPSDKHDRITFQYSTAGKTSVSDALLNTASFWIDSRGRTVRVENPLGNSADLYYDGYSNLTAVLGPTGLASFFGYDESGKLIGVQDPMGYVTSFGYGGDYQDLIWVRDARGNMMSYEYDASGNLLSISYEDGTAEHYMYDAAGNLTSYTNRRGSTITCESNTRGQLTSKLYEDGSEVSYAYDDPLGRSVLTTATDSRGDTILEYDPDNEWLTRIVYPEGRWLRFEYDTLGRRTRMVDQDEFTVNYAYDAAGRLEQLTDASGANVVTYHYDAAGRLVGEDKGVGESTTFAVYTTYVYDAAGHILELTNSAGDGTVNSRFRYTYDALGRRTSMEVYDRLGERDGTWTYSYDANAQLIRAQFDSTGTAIGDQDYQYEYDPVGNRIRTVINGEVTEYTTNNMNQYTQVGDFYYEYDDDGNLISKTNGTETWTYVYNDESRLVGVIGPDGTWEYEYDALDNRVAVHENGAVTDCVIDPIGLGDVVSEYDAVGELVARYNHGYGLLNRLDSAGFATYYTFDALGNTSELTPADGVVRNAYTYLPFGELIWSIEPLANPFQHGGRWGAMAEANNLNYMRARFYDASLGRFTAIDPIGLNGGDVNLYRYVHNDPIQFLDPSGLQRREGSPDAREPSVEEQIRNDPHFRRLRFLDRIFGIPTGSWPISLTDMLARGWGQALDHFNEATRPPGQGNAPRLPSSPANPYGTPIDPGSTPGTPFDPGSTPGTPIDPGSTLGTPIDPGSTLGTPIDSGSIPVGASSTPEDKFGPPGYDAPDTPTGSEQRFIVDDATRALGYRIDFWNDPGALVPTQDAIIEDTFDPNLFDLDTFQFTRFGFLRWDVPLEGTQAIAARVDLRPDMNLAVDVTAGFDPETGVASWWFHAVDPLTGDYPEDPMAGFLPPFSPETEYELGWVEFTVQLKEGLPTGTRIENQAYVEFDFLGDLYNHPAPKEGPWGNTIDAGPPSSQVDPLPAVTSLGFQVSWSGADDPGGSGVATYDVYVSTDGGEFNTWLANTTDTSAAFGGVPGHTYAFYSVASDNVGHREAAPPVADTETTLQGIVADLGTLAFLELQDLPCNGEAYRMTAAHAGFLTLEAVTPDPPQSVTIHVYDQDGYLLGASTANGSNHRVEIAVTVGETYYFKLTGTAADVDLRLANLVSHTGTTVTVYGTDDEDLFTFDATASRLVTINGVPYHFTDAEATFVSFDGSAAVDTAILTGNNQNERAELWPGHGTLTGEGYSVAISNVETVTAVGGEGIDVALLHDNPELKDTLTGDPDTATLFGNGYSHQVTDFRYVHVYGTPGNGDEALLQGDPNGQDTFKAWPDQAKLYGDEFFLRAKSFRDVRADGTPGGGDVALLHDNPEGIDTFEGGPDSAELSGDEFFLQANSFRYVHAYATAGSGDVATFNDDPDRFDKLRVWPGEAKLFGEEFFLRAKSFRSVYANSTPGGGDQALLYDSITDDTFTAWPDRAELSGDAFFIQTNSFRYVHSYSTEGNDVATLYGSDERDVFVGTDRFGKLRGTSFYNRAVSFGQLHVYGGSGRDVATLHDAVLESGVTEPLDMTQVAWLYEFERIRQRSDDGETVINVVDQIFTAYWE